MHGGLYVGHKQRRGHAFAGNVGDAESRFVIAELQHVVVITTDRASRSPCCCDAATFDLRNLGWQQPALNASRFDKLSLLFFLEAQRLAQRVTHLDLCAKDCKQPVILPGLQHKVAHASLHRFDSKLDAAPRGHHHDGQRAVYGLNSRQQIEAFLAGRRIACIVEIHQQQIEIVRLQRLDDIVRRRDAFGLIAFAFE